VRVLTVWKIILSLFTTLVVLSACGGGGGSSSGDGNPLPTKTLSWAAPDSYTDNTPLNPLTDLNGFEIYVNESDSFSYGDTPNAVVGAGDTSYNLAKLANLSKGIAYRVSMRAVAVTGLKSDFSPPASFSF
jgi:hypothetical protein